MKKIAIVVTNVAKYPSMARATGAWLGEIVHFAKVAQAEGYAIDYISPSGGFTPIDPHSLAMADETDWQWYENREFMNALGATKRASDVDANDYAAIYYAGGHGVMWDFVDDEALQQLSATIYAQGGIVSAVCHGVVGLLNIVDETGKRLIAGKKVTGFTNVEEEMAQLTEHVPFLTEDELVKQGGSFVQAEAPWAPFAVEDGRLVTGQNPASSEAVAQLVFAQLRA